MILVAYLTDSGVKVDVKRVGEIIWVRDLSDILFEMWVGSEN